MNIGLNVFEPSLEDGYFGDRTHVFYVVKYDPYTLKCLNNHMGARQWNVVI